MRHTLFLLSLALTLLVSFQSCIEDGLATSASCQPAFSTDTLRLGTVWTGTPTPTYRFTVYNRHDKILNLSRVAFRDDSRDVFRLNVDGTAGSEITDIEIRPNDSVFVFIEATLPETGLTRIETVTSHIDFLVNGVTSSLPVVASARDLRRMHAAVITSDTVFTPDYPIQVFDSLVVAPGATLTLDPGTQLLFHDKAKMIVRGTLIAAGTPEHRIDMTGDRTGNVVASIPYDIMSGQWSGLSFASGSVHNRLDFTTVRNSTEGTALGSLASLEMRGAVLRNANGFPLSATGASITAVGCEIAEGGDGVISLDGGTYRFDHCTVANHYLFSVFGGPAIQIGNVKGSGATAVEFSNSIIYGLGDELSPTDLTDTSIRFVRCLFGSSGSDDDHFVNCLWQADPLYLLDRSKYIFDYHLQQKSPALGEAGPCEFVEIMSPDGVDIERHIGAYGPAR